MPLLMSLYIQCFIGNKAPLCWQGWLRRRSQPCYCLPIAWPDTIGLANQCSVEYY